MDCLKRLKGKTFSARSQASYRREAILRGQLFNIKSRVSRCQRTIGEAQEEIGRLTRNAISGESWAAELIPKSRAMIRAQEEQIAIFEPERVRVQAELNALINPSSAEATARAENQLALAQLAVVIPTVGITVPLVFDVWAAGHELRIDLRQRPAGIRRLRLALHDRPEAVHNNSVPGIGTAVHKSRLLASGFDLIARVGPRGLRGGRQGKHYQAGEPE